MAEIFAGWDHVLAGRVAYLAPVHRAQQRERPVVLRLRYQRESLWTSLCVYGLGRQAEER